MHKQKTEDLKKKYFQAMQLLDDVGPWSLRLNSVQKIVSAKDFLYDESENPTPFLYVFMHSAYWLDQELFDPRVINQRYCRSNSTEEQRIHMRLLDIGCILIEKGFPLERIMSQKAEKLNPTENWAHVFWEQCQKRHIFLKQYRCTHQQGSPKNASKNGRERS